MGASAVDVWPVTPGQPPTVLPLANYSAYQTAARGRVALFTQPPIDDRVHNEWLPDGTPVISTAKNLFYPQLDPKNATGDLAARLAAALAQLPPPSFVLCYGLVGGQGLFDTINGALHALLPAQAAAARPVHVVSIDDLARLARLMNKE